MAEHAQQEPTMEEILSSIRKIIADDSGDQALRQQASEPQSLQVAEVDDESFDDLELTVADSPELAELAERLTADAFELENRPAPELVADDAFLEEDDLLSDDDFDRAVTAPEVYTAESDVDEDFFENEFEDVTELDVATEAEPEPEPEPPFQPDPAPSQVLEMVEPTEPEVPEYPEDPIVAEEEPEMPAVPAEHIETSAEQADALSDTRTADAAAGSLGKLLSRVEVGPAESSGTPDGSTIEDVVKSLLRPMLKDWLDQNLPALVEKHVEAEVQRIARMAR